MTTIEPRRLAEVFVEAADTLVDDFDMIEFLQMVTLRTSELVAAAAVGLLLDDGRGRLQFMAASSEATRLLEVFQIQHNEGPCLDAFTTGAPVVNADLRSAEDRWPTFAPRATAVGFRSVHALPLRLRSTVIGALNLFGSDVPMLEAAEVAIVQSLADVATIGLLQQHAIRRGEILTEQLQHALNSRVVIEQAKGVLALIHGVDVDAAFELLRSYARSHNRKLVDLARLVVTEPRQIPDLTK